MLLLFQNFQKIPCSLLEFASPESLRSCPFQFHDLENIFLAFCTTDLGLRRKTQQRWRQGRNAGGTKIVKVPTASEASKIFKDHTFLIGSKFAKTLLKIVLTVPCNFQKCKFRRGLSEILGRSFPPSCPGRAIPETQSF